MSPNPTLTVRRVHTPADLDAFLSLPERLLAADPAFVPPPREVLARRIGPRSPLRRDGSLCLYLAERDGRAVGRISALLDRRHVEHREERVAFFGFFDCEDDPRTAEALMNAVARQARDWGMDALRGPRNLSRIEEVGALVDGFDAAPPFLAGHGAPWTERLLLGLGMRPHHDVLAYDALMHDGDGQPRAIPEALAQRAAAVAIPGLVIRPASWRHPIRDLKLAHEVFVCAFADVPDNTPMTLRQFVAVGGAMLLASSRHMLQLATVHGRPAGFALCFPEINEALARAGGRLAPLGWLRALWGLRSIRTASFKLLGVLPEHRRSGLHALMITRALEGARDAGYARVEASLIDGRNAPMRAVVEGAGMAIYKRYRLYERAV